MPHFKSLLVFLMYQYLQGAGNLRKNTLGLDDKSNTPFHGERNAVSLTVTGRFAHRSADYGKNFYPFGDLHVA